MAIQSTDIMQYSLNFHNFIYLERTVVTFIWKHKISRITKTILNSESTAGGLSIAEFKMCYRAGVMKLSWYWCKSRSFDQWNWIEYTDIIPQPVDVWLFCKEATNTYLTKREHHQQMVLVKLDVFVQKNLKWPIPSLWIKLKFNWSKTLNMKPDTLNLIEE